MILVNLPYQEHPAHFLRAGESVSWSFSGWLIHWGAGDGMGVAVPAATENTWLSQIEETVNVLREKWPKSIVKEVMTKLNEEKGFQSDSCWEPLEI